MAARRVMGGECTQREFTDTAVVYILGGMEQDRGRPCQITQNYAQLRLWREFISGVFHLVSYDCKPGKRKFAKRKTG